MSAFGNPEIPTNGLELNFDAFNTVSYPGSGTAWYNMVRGNVYQSQLIVGTGLIYEDGISTITCSGSGDRTAAGTGVEPTLGDEYCYVSFCKLLPDNGLYRTLYRTIPDDHPILIQTSTNLLGVYDNTGGSTFNSSGYDMSPYEGTWFSIFANASGGDTTDMYINGELVGSAAFNATGNAHYAIGGSSGNGQPWGWVSQTLLYNRQLTIGEVQRIHNAFRSRYGI